jgi:hypothetical protein
VEHPLENVARGIICRGEVPDTTCVPRHDLLATVHSIKQTMISQSKEMMKASWLFIPCVLNETDREAPEAHKF